MIMYSIAMEMFTVGCWSEGQSYISRVILARLHWASELCFRLPWCHPCA
jgi:hypothetical protein